jgi:hypothetical protein
MFQGNNQLVFDLVMVSDFFEGPPLAFFRALSIGDVKESEFISLFIGDGGGYARVHTSRHQANRQPQPSFLWFGLFRIRASGFVIPTH